MHIDVPAAMQGVCRFGEEFPAWAYSKEEGLADRSAFDYLVTADAKVEGFHAVASVDAFAGLQWTDVGAWAGVAQLQGVHLPLPAVQPAMHILEADLLQ